MEIIVININIFFLMKAISFPESVIFCYYFGFITKEKKFLHYMDKDDRPHPILNALLNILKNK